jgi:type VI secretion system protein VasD
VEDIVIQFQRTLFTLFLGMLAISSGLSGCALFGMGPDPTELEVTIEASANLNPNAEGRPSPIVIRFYELSSVDVFETSDFFTLYDNEMATLGKFIQFRDEMNIKPGDRKSFELEAKPETRYVGIIAAYRDLDNARWRGILKVEPHEKTKMIIHLGSLAVSITEIKPKSPSDSRNYNKNDL